MTKHSPWQDLALSLLPLILAIAIDQWSKQYAVATLGTSGDFDFGVLRFKFLANYGFMLGSLKEMPALYTVVIPTTLGAYLLYILALIQYFLPIYSPVLRCGLSLYIGSVVANMIDRAIYGYVIDFVQLRAFGKVTGIFNIADAMQWVGVAMFLTSYFRNGKILYPANERRGRKWIDPAFQLRFCASLISAGLFFALVGGTLAATFLKITVADTLPADSLARFLRDFAWLYATTSTVFFITLFVVGVQLSHRMIGPIKGFENFMHDLLEGRIREFKRRRNDEFAELDTIAARFYKYFADDAGITPRGLMPGDRAPGIVGVTMQKAIINPEVFAGQKTWLIFYRYATCPLCVLHMHENRENFRTALKSGIKVVAVFESTPEQFANPNAGAAMELLQTQEIMLVADPDRTLYNRYRTMVRLWTLFRPRALIRLIKAQLSGFKQSTIDGALGQIPAHFIISPEGKIAKVYYGADPVDHPPFSWVMS